MSRNSICFHAHPALAEVAPLSGERHSDVTVLRRVTSIYQEQPLLGKELSLRKSKAHVYHRGAGDAAASPAFTSIHWQCLPGGLGAFPRRESE